MLHTREVTLSIATRIIFRHAFRNWYLMKLVKNYNLKSNETNSINRIRKFVIYDTLRLVRARVAAWPALSPPTAVDSNYTKECNPENLFVCVLKISIFVCPRPLLWPLPAGRLVQPSRSTSGLSSDQLQHMLCAHARPIDHSANPRCIQPFDWLLSRYQSTKTRLVAFPLTLYALYQN